MENKTETRSPKLLVSVRNLNEAIEAIAGGCDWVDLKEPNHGALGKPDEATLASVSQYFETEKLTLPLSTALGEFAEFIDQTDLHLPASIRFGKFGLSQLASNPNWKNQLCRFYEENPKIKPVAVYYADCERAASPTIDEVMEFAIRSDALYFLIDTFVKDETTLIDWINEAELQRVSDFCKQENIQLALAGRIQEKNLSTLGDIPFDIVAVRSAVCENGDRNKAITRNSVSKFRESILQKLSFDLGRDIAVTPAG